MAVGPALREQLATIVPTWIANIPGLRKLFSYLWTIALLGDCLREIAIEGQFAAYPGLGTPTALPYIGASRGLVQAPGEPDANFAARCVTWLIDAAMMGQAESVATQIQRFLVAQGSLGIGVYPVVAVVDRSGRTVTANADQTITISQSMWNWDEVHGWVDRTKFRPPSEVDTYWSDMWVVIQDPYRHYTGFSDPNWLAAWNSGDQTVDSLCPQGVVDGIKSILGTWRGAHMYVRNVIFVPTVSSFLSAPNGTWGNYSINISGTQTATRTAAYSYWQTSLNG
jgi:hypothetical protein